jgi:hypothetical protein
LLGYCKKKEVSIFIVEKIESEFFRKVPTSEQWELIKTLGKLIDADG